MSKPADGHRQAIRAAQRATLQGSSPSKEVAEEEISMAQPQGLGQLAAVWLRPASVDAADATGKPVREPPIAMETQL